MFNLIGNLHNYEYQILIELSKKLADKATKTLSIANNYQEFTEKIELNQSQHKVLAFLFSIYHLDQSSKTKHKQTLSDITRSVCYDNSRSDRMMRSCIKLVKLGLIYKDKNRKYYITKYGIFFMYSECQEVDWDGELIANATLAAIEKELNIEIKYFISKKLKKDKRKNEIIIKHENEEK